jgi:hypothetical protein
MALTIDMKKQPDIHIRLFFHACFFGREDVMRHWPKEKAILD